jgi:GNAT superfamily N-acetyltransferase
MAMGRFHADGIAVIIRLAREADAGSVARLVVDTWRITYAGLIPSDYLAGMAAAEATERWRRAILTRGVIVAEAEDGQIVGVGFCGEHRTRLGEYEGEIFALYVDTDSQGGGVGRRLMGAMARHLLEEGIAKAFLWCLRDNPSRWFYERVGGRVVAERTERFAGTDLAELAYGWSDLGALAGNAADEL